MISSQTISHRNLDNHNVTFKQENLEIIFKTYYQNLGMLLLSYKSLLPKTGIGYYINNLSQPIVNFPNTTNFNINTSRRNFQD